MADAENALRKAAPSIQNVSAEMAELTGTANVIKLATASIAPGIVASAFSERLLRVLLPVRVIRLPDLNVVLEIGMKGKWSKAMIKLKSAATIAALTTLLTAQAGTATLANNMSAYKWKNRPLLVFAPVTGGDKLNRQLAIVRANASGLRNRDMVVIVIKGGSVSFAKGRRRTISAAALRKRYGIGRDAFRAILIGKDGGSKLSSGSPLSAGQLFRTIDAMPMRRDEIRRRGN